MWTYIMMGKQSFDTLYRYLMKPSSLNTETADLLAIINGLWASQLTWESSSLPWWKAKNAYVPCLKSLKADVLLHIKSCLCFFSVWSITSHLNFSERLKSFKWFCSCVEMTCGWPHIFYSVYSLILTGWQMLCGVEFVYCTNIKCFRCTVPFLLKKI